MFSAFLFPDGFFLSWTSRYVNYTLRMKSVLCATFLVYGIILPWIATAAPFERGVVECHLGF